MEISTRIRGDTFDELQLRTFRLSSQLTRVYDRFFEILAENVLDVAAESDTAHGYAETPPLIAAYMGGAGRWQALSEKWINVKSRPMFANLPDGFYHGLTASVGAVSHSRLGRTRQPGSQPRKAHIARPNTGAKTPFSKFIHGLAKKSGSTERFFGPFEIEYKFYKEGRLFKVTKTPEQGVEEIEVKSDKTGKFVMFPRDYSMGAELTAFPKLAQIGFNEWQVVDFILKRIDPANEKQWVKINARTGFAPKKRYSANKKGQKLSEGQKYANRMGRGHRPIRALITPLISWYHKVAFEQAMRQFGGIN